MSVARYLVILAIPVVADFGGGPGQSSGCCDPTPSETVLAPFASTCTASADCNGGLQCLPTVQALDASTCANGGADGGAGAGADTCTQACTSDADCTQFSEYVKPFCSPCNATGAPRVCTHL